MHPIAANRYADPAARAAGERLMRWATYASVGVALVLIVAKFAAWVVTGSVSVLATLVDSLLDALASMINLVAIHHALQPADREHRFGHGKAEPLAGLAQSAFISGSAVFLVIEAGQRLIRPRAPVEPEVGIAVVVVSLVLTLGLVLFQRYVVRRTGSVAIGADSLHYASDLYLNLGVIASLVLSSRFGLPLADPVIALAVAIYILWGAARIARGSLDQLMDRELPDSERERIRAIALAHPQVTEVHDLRTRSSGTQLFIQLDVEMDGALTLAQSHAVAEAVMGDVAKAFPNAEVFIHQDPAGIVEEHRAHG